MITALGEVLTAELTETAPAVRDLSHGEELTAVHEAGHIVVGLVLGLPATGISMRAQTSPRSDLPLGVAVFGSMLPMEALEAMAECKCDPIPLAYFLERRWRVPDYLVMLAAGRVAEARAAGRSLTSNYGGGWNDRLVAEHLLGEMLKQPPFSQVVHKCLNVIEQVASGHVARQWEWIARVASALCRERTLNGDDILKLRGRR